jgi:aryl-alcohol dehydrogenase-like predicted oxidoreductase
VSAATREQIGGQLQRLGTDSIDLWVLRGFNEKETSVEDTMAAVKVICVIHSCFPS